MFKIVGLFFGLVSCLLWTGDASLSYAAPKPKKKADRQGQLPGKPLPRLSPKELSSKKPKKRLPGKAYIPLSKEKKVRPDSTPMPGVPDKEHPVDRDYSHGRDRGKKRKKPFRVRPLKHVSNNVFMIDPSAVKKVGLGVPLSKDSLQVISHSDQKEIRDIRRQLKADPMPIPKNLGGVFVPNITEGEGVRATSYILYDAKGQEVAIAETGRKSFVLPGRYTVQIGSRATDTLPRYRIRVEKGRLTIIRPRWAALVIRIVDERLIQFRGTYDIIHLKSRRSIGTGIGADGTLGEKVLPWLLQPGLYMIVRVGDSYLARTNFFTVQVDQGKVTVFRLVANKDTGNFLGGGVILNQGILKAKKKSNWKWGLQLNGSILWSQIENTPGTTSGSSFSLTTFLFGRLSYNSKRHFFLTTLNSELGFTLPSQGDLRKSGDRLELQSIYIFRILPFIGPYLRLGVEVSMFPDLFTFGSDDLRLLESGSVYVCNAASCRLTKEVGPGQLKQVELAGPFDPFLLREGIGFNIQAVRHSSLNLRVLFGLGFRQDLSRSVFQLNPSTDIASQRCKNPSKRNPNNPVDLSGCPSANQQEAHTTVRLFERISSRREGIEMAVVATGRVTRFVTFATELDSLIQFNLQAFKLDIDWRSTVTVRLSHYAAIIYRLRLKRDSSLTPNPNNPEWSLWAIEQSVLLSFSLLL